MIKVLGRTSSGNVQKVLFFLEETVTPYEREDYGRGFDNTGTDEYLAMNPAGKVPTVLDGDTVIWESNTILRYLAAQYAPGLHGDDAVSRTQVERWMDFLLAAVGPGYLAAFKGSTLAPADRAADYAVRVKDLVVQMAILDGHLAGREYFALDRLTLADVALGPIIRRSVDCDIERPPMPNLERWIEAISARDSFARATGYVPPAGAGHAHRPERTA